MQSIPLGWLFIELSYAINRHVTLLLKCIRIYHKEIKISWGMQERYSGFFAVNFVLQMLIIIPTERYIYEPEACAMWRQDIDADWMKTMSFNSKFITNYYMINIYCYYELYTYVWSYWSFVLFLWIIVKIGSNG